MRLSTMLKWLMMGAAVAALCVWFYGLITYTLMLYGMYAGMLALVVVFSMVSLACAATMERGRIRPLMWSGIAASAASLIGWSSLIWIQSQMFRSNIESTARLFGTTTIWSVFCMLLALMWRHRLDSLAARAARLLTVACASILGTAMVVIMYSNVRSRGDSVERFFIAMSVFTVFGLLTTMVLAHLRQLASGEELAESADSIRLEYTAWCPRCGMEQTLHTGGGACQGCGLSIKVSVP